MKTLLMLILLILICAPFAQGELVKGFGFKTGVVIANQDFDYADQRFSLDTKSRTGFDLGGFVEWFDLKSFSLLTEAHYIQKGMKEEITRTSERGEPLPPLVVHHRADYISLSALGKFILPGKFISPYFIAGPRLDLLPGNNSIAGDDFYRDFKSTVFGGDIGVGAEFNIVDFGTILSEFRYSHDFSKAYKTDFLQVKNRSFQILFGFRL